MSRGTGWNHDIPVLREHAVQHERVQVDIEIQRTAEALHDRHRATATIRDALSPGAASQEPEHHPQRDADDGATQRVIPGEQVAQPMRQAQDPLSDRHIRQHVIDQMRRSLSHAAAAAPGAEATALARKRDEAILSARVAPEAREAGSEASAPQEVAELLLDKSRKPLAVPQRRGVRTKGLEMVPHDAVQDV